MKVEFPIEKDWTDKGGDGGYVGNVGGGELSRGAGPYGALDMAGNVWEWVADWYDEAYYANSPIKNPHGPDSGETSFCEVARWRLQPPRGSLRRPV